MTKTQLQHDYNPPPPPPGSIVNIELCGIVSFSISRNKNIFHHTPNWCSSIVVTFDFH